MSNNKKRVVMVTPKFPLNEGKVNGGIESASLNLCLALSKIKEIELIVVNPFSPSSYQGLKNIYDLQVYFLSTPKHKMNYFDKFERNNAMRLLSRLKPDIVHFQTSPKWAYLCEHRNIYTVHGISELDVLHNNPFPLSILKYIILKKLDGAIRRKILNVIAISPYSYNFLDFQNQNIWDIPNAVSDDFFSIIQKPIAGRIFSASTMNPLKNTHSLIKAFSQLTKRYPFVKLVLAGGGQNNKYGIYCKKMVDSMNLTSNVEFKGLLSVREIQNELSIASCFALCSKQENAPIAVAEAMAAGVPIVASRVGGLPWMINDGLDGKLIDPMDINDITKKLEMMISEKHSTVLALNAKNKANKIYKSDIVASKTYEAYMSILHS